MEAWEETTRARNAGDRLHVASSAAAPPPPGGELIRKNVHQNVQVFAHFRTCAIQNRSAHRFVFRRLRRAGGGADGRIHAPRSSPKVPELLPAGARRESRSSAMFFCLILLHDSARYRTRALPWLPDGCTPSVTHESIDMTCAPMPARRLARAWTPPITWHVRRRAEF